MCSRCNRATGFGELGFDTGEIGALYDECAMRIAANPVIRCCDDPKAWDWRAFLKERRAS